jgi:hypothetical protein
VIENAKGGNSANFCMHPCGFNRLQPLECYYGWIYFYFLEVEEKERRRERREEDKKIKDFDCLYTRICDDGMGCCPMYGHGESKCNPC